ncbi:transposase domain-containing protein [Acidihalobacter yilgarnensis]
MNGLDPMTYLRQALAMIATHPINRNDELLPWQLPLPSVPDAAKEVA